MLARRRFHTIGLMTLPPDISRRARGLDCQAGLAAYMPRSITAMMRFPPALAEEGALLLAHADLLAISRILPQADAIDRRAAACLLLSRCIPTMTKIPMQYYGQDIFIDALISRQWRLPPDVPCTAAELMLHCCGDVYARHF